MLLQIVTALSCASEVKMNLRKINSRQPAKYMVWYGMVYGGAAGACLWHLAAQKLGQTIN